MKLFRGYVQWALVALRNTTTSALTARLFQTVLKEVYAISVSLIDESEAASLAQSIGDTNSTRTNDLIGLGIIGLDLEAPSNKPGTLGYDVLVANGGPKGYSPRSGWYIPSYLLDADSDLASYVAFKFADKVACFSGTSGRSSVNFFAAYSNAQDYTRDAMANLTACAAAQGSKADRLLAGTTPLFASKFGPRGVLLAPAQRVYSGSGTNLTLIKDGEQDAAIINRLGLYLQVAEIPSASADDAIIANLTATYNATSKAAWLGHITSPSHVLDSSPNMSLTRITLPDVSSSCTAAYASTGTTCPCDFGSPLYNKRYHATRLSSISPALVSVIKSWWTTTPLLNAMLALVKYQNLTVADAACARLKAEYPMLVCNLPTWVRARPTCAAGAQAVFLASQLGWSCEACPEGTFNPAANGSCIACPAGAICPGGSEYYIAAGYWNHPAATATEPKIYACLEAAACCAPDAGNVGCAANVTCVAGRTGLLCNECAQAGFYKWNEKCVDCSDGGMVVLLPVLLLVLGVGMVIFCNISNESLTLFMADLLLFFQLTGFILESDKSGQSAFFDLVSLKFLNMLEGTIPTNVCPAALAETPKLILESLTPAVFWVYLALYHVAALTTSAWTVESVNQRWFKYYVSLYVVTFMPMLDGVLKAALGVPCFQGSHLAMAGVAAVVLAITFVVIPVGAMWKVCAFQRAGQLANPAVLDTWGAFYAVFRESKQDHYFAWDVVKQGLIVSLCQGLPRNTELTNSVALAIMFLHAHTQPAHNRLDNFLRLVAYTSMLAMTGVSLLTLPAASSSYSAVNALKYSLMGIFVAAPCVLVPWYVSQVVLKLRREFRARQVKARERHGSSSSKKLRAAATDALQLAWMQERHERTR
ncbi:hypothetical protein H9P43_004065 [Blastocladiella emersonii ATCC 22665]|nr:hypothetical protein H9P43_004065 [Blastocladiella emersonii ATCC 22665]